MGTKRKPQYRIDTYKNSSRSPLKHPFVELSLHPSSQVATVVTELDQALAVVPRTRTIPTLRNPQLRSGTDILGIQPRLFTATYLTRPHPAVRVHRSPLPTGKVKIRICGSAKGYLEKFKMP